MGGHPQARSGPFTLSQQDCFFFTVLHLGQWEHGDFSGPKKNTNKMGKSSQIHQEKSAARVTVLVLDLSEPLDLESPEFQIGT